MQESLAEQLEEGYRQSIWLPQRGRLQPQTVGGGYAARLELTTHIEKGLYALFVSGGPQGQCECLAAQHLRVLLPQYSKRPYARICMF